MVAVLYHDGALKSTRRMRLGSDKHCTVFEGKGIGMILRLELIREEELAEGMVSIRIDNVAAICYMSHTADKWLDTRGEDLSSF